MISFKNNVFAKLCFFDITRITIKFCVMETAKKCENHKAENML